MNVHHYIWDSLRVVSPFPVLDLSFLIIGIESSLIRHVKIRDFTSYQVHYLELVLMRLTVISQDAKLLKRKMLAMRERESNPRGKLTPDPSLETRKGQYVSRDSSSSSRWEAQYPSYRHTHSINVSVSLYSSSSSSVLSKINIKRRRTIQSVFARDRETRLHINPRDRNGTLISQWVES